MNSYGPLRATKLTAPIALRQAGLLNRAQLLNLGFASHQINRLTRNGSWFRVTSGVYNVLPNHQWPDPMSTARLQSAWTGLLSHPRSISTGLCALALHGIWGLPRNIAPEVALPNGEGAPGASGVHVRRYRGFPTTHYCGREVAVPTAALVHALPHTTRAVGVALLDSALHRRLIRTDDLEVIETQLAGRRGAVRVRPWLTQADANAQSPLETHTRVQCMDAGLPTPHLQICIRDDAGNLIARGDLGWRRADDSWVLLEIDGRSFHDTPAALFHDRHRQNNIALAGRHTLLRFTAGEVYSGVIPEIVKRARDMAAVPS